MTTYPSTGGMAAPLASFQFERNSARRTYRVAVYEDLVNRHVKLIRDRAEQCAGAPGGDTRLIVRQLKVIGVGKNQREVEE